MLNVRSRRTVSVWLLILSALAIAATALTGVIAATAAGPPPVGRSVFFHSPTGNIQCELERRADGSTTAYCQTFHTPKSVALGASGHLHVCRGVPCLGNGPRTSRQLSYGQSVHFGAVTCTSMRTGVTCVSHRHGFVINRAGIRAVTAATKHVVVCPPQTSNAGDVALYLDLDGNGVLDTLSLNGGSLHVILGAGHGELSTPFSTASPYVTALAVSADGTRGDQVLIGTRGAISGPGEVGVVARLYDLRGCTFAPVLGANGKPYDFMVGQQSQTRRSGVVCQGGVLSGRTSVLRGGVWQVTDTPVSSVSGIAVNGAPRHSTVRDGTARARGLTSETCGRNPTTLG